MDARRDVRVPESQAREIARLIPDSRLVLLDSANHILDDTEPAWQEVLDEVEHFLA